MATEDEIRTMAYKLWEEEGHPDGKHEEHYFRAAKMLEEQQRMNSLPSVSKASSPQARSRSGSKRTK
jgi:hypothetical protein